MAQLIKPGSVSVVTQEGEIRISLTLDLNVNLNSGGITVQAAEVSQKAEAVKPKVTDWEIPDFGDSMKIDFGK